MQILRDAGAFESEEGNNGGGIGGVERRGNGEVGVFNKLFICFINDLALKSGQPE